MHKILFIAAIFLFSTSLIASSEHLHSKSYLIQIPAGERGEDWVKEYQLGACLARAEEYELALQSFKRAFFLIPPEKEKRRSEVQYAILLVHYLTHHYDEVVRVFEKSSLLYQNSDFVAYHDLIVILFESYERVNQPQKADHMIKILQKEYPQEAEELLLSHALMRQDFKKIEGYSLSHPKRHYLSELTHHYKTKLKSPTVAKWLGIICPGAGYFYAKQPKAGVSSFLVNSLLIGATAQLFMAHFYVLGALVATFELGWYVGGVLGGKSATEGYNAYLYQNYQHKIIHEENLNLESKLDYEF